MRNPTKSYLISVILIAGSMFSSASIYAFNGNWSAKYKLGDGHYVEHTPSYVSLDGAFKAGQSIQMNRVIVNGTRFENVYLYTDSTKDEFTYAVKCIRMTKVN